MVAINLLPKSAGKSSESSYWRLIAIVFVLLAGTIIAAWHFLTQSNLNRLIAEKTALEQELATLQVYVRRRDELLQTQAQLRDLIAIRDRVKEGNIEWSEEIRFMLSTLPAPDSDLGAKVSFMSLSMNALTPNEQARLSADGSYENVSPAAEMEITGAAINAAVLADYLLILQDTERIAADFQSTSLDDRTGTYNFSVTVGIEVGDKGEDGE